MAQDEPSETDAAEMAASYTQLMREMAVQEFSSSEERMTWFYKALSKLKLPAEKEDRLKRLWEAEQKKYPEGFWDRLLS